MNFTEAIRAVFSKYATFSGRSRRAEYWWFGLFGLIVNVIFRILMAALIGPALLIVAILEIAWVLGVILPALAVAVRRLHDVDRSGWWILVIFVPVIGWIFLLIWNCSRGTNGPNRFGSDPLVDLGDPMVT